MLFVVYIKPQDAWRSDAGPLMIGAFLMKSDAQALVNSYHIKDELAIAEVDNVWDDWMAIKAKLETTV